MRFNAKSIRSVAKAQEGRYNKRTKQRFNSLILMLNNLIYQSALQGGFEIKKDISDREYNHFILFDKNNTVKENLFDTLINYYKSRGFNITVEDEAYEEYLSFGLYIHNILHKITISWEEANKDEI